MIIPIRTVFKEFGFAIPTIVNIYFMSAIGFITSATEVVSVISS
jgi:hypothetical protein